MVEAVLGVARTAAGLGFGVCGVVRSPLPGPSGNVEFFLWLRRADDGSGVAVPVESITASVLGGDR